jgi:uncharacterized protein YgiM (DUF1202 family)
MAEEKIFADGFVFKRNENAPDFVVGRISIKVNEAIEFIKKHEKNGWVNLGVKTARSGNYYIDLDTFESNDSSKKEGAVDKYEAKSKAKVEEPEDDLPF